MIYIILLLALIALLLQAAALRRLSIRPGEPAELRDEAWGWAVRPLTWLLVAGLVIWLALRVQAIFPPFLLALAIAYLLNPLLDRLERWRLPRSSGIALVFLAFLGIFFAIALLVVPPLVQQIDQLVTDFPKYAERASYLTARAEHAFRLAHLPPYIEQALTSVGDSASAAIRSVAQSIPGMLLRSFSVGMLLIITPIVTYWFLKEWRPLRARLLTLVPERPRGHVTSILSDINNVLGGYLRGMAVTCSLVGLCALVVFEIVQVAYPLPLALLAAVGYLIPYVGVPTAAGVASLVAYLTGGHSGLQIALMAASLFVINFLSDYLIYPRVVGGRVGLHPLLVIFALLAGAQLWGVLGMVAAVPLAACIKVVVDRFVPALSAVPADPASEA